jgi:type I restriction enzyme S subunit
LGEVFKERKEPGKVNLPIASVSIESGLTLRPSLDRRVETNLMEEDHALVKKNDIAYNMMRMWQGACGLAMADCCVSPAYVVMTPAPDVLPNFAFHMLRSPSMIKLLHGYSQGIVDDRLRLYPANFNQIPVNLPPLGLQRAVADIFFDFDQSKARALEALLSLKAIKDRVLSDLVNGRVRVPA